MLAINKIKFRKKERHEWNEEKVQKVTLGIEFNLF